SNGSTLMTQIYASMVKCKLWSTCSYAAPPEAVVTTAVTNMGHVAMPASHSLAFPDPLFVSLVFGISVALMSYCTWPLSGGHLNPAVTLSMLVAMKVRPSWALCYILAQLLGAITTSALLYGLTPEHSLGEMGINKVRVTSLQALAIEMIVSFQYILCILSTSENRRDPSKCGHLIIGLSVTLGHLIGYTGCGMNPARSLGPALITFVFTNHWVFWVGPLAGGLAAAILNEWVLFPKCSGFRQWLTMLQEKLQEDRNSQATAENLPGFTAFEEESSTKHWLLTQIVKG
uniref:Aquaporin 6 n=1 Tax=Crocodylus porosus TaxID=8502 RepID=A0A7M4ERL4_CROPO